MERTPGGAPLPDLRIVPIDRITPHEVHDPQRAQPLVERIREADYLTNPPIVAEGETGHYVILDGSNRFFSFKQLGYEHLLVQVVHYREGFVELGVWQHIVSDWDEDALLQALQEDDKIQVNQGWQHDNVAQILLQSGMVLGLNAAVATIAERNETLRRVVATYHDNGTLYRTPLTDPTAIWRLYPKAVALVLFPRYEPEDILEAARHQAYLPPGVSRHIIHGRALKLNYPLDWLRDAHEGLDAKNERLQTWLQDKLAVRAVRYYEESTYQFDE